MTTCRAHKIEPELIERLRDTILLRSRRPQPVQCVDFLDQAVDRRGSRRSGVGEKGPETGFRGKEASSSRGLAWGYIVREKRHRRRARTWRSTSLIKCLQPFPGDVKYDSRFLHLPGTATSRTLFIGRW